MSPNLIHLRCSSAVFRGTWTSEYVILNLCQSVYKIADTLKLEESLSQKLFIFDEVYLNDLEEAETFHASRGRN